MKTTEKENWIQLRARLLANFPNLTAEDVNFDSAKKEEVLSRVARKAGITMEELEEVISMPG